MPEANAPMSSAVNVPVALVLLDAARPDRVASCCAQDVPMLSETVSPTLHPAAVVDQTAKVSPTHEG